MFRSSTKPGTVAREFSEAGCILKSLSQLTQCFLPSDRFCIQRYKLLRLETSKLSIFNSCLPNRSAGFLSSSSFNAFANRSSTAEASPPAGVLSRSGRSILMWEHGRALFSDFVILVGFMHCFPGCAVAMWIVCMFKGCQQPVQGGMKNRFDWDSRLQSDSYSI